LVAYQADGRPVINPKHANNPRATYRLEESKVLLNLDHPDFNAKREQLFHEISRDVKAYNELPEEATSRRAIYDGLNSRLQPEAPFSVAARYYLAMHREHAWVERLLKKP
jgi:hypothetical protein